jgi:hypothetical protein
MSDDPRACTHTLKSWHKQFVEVLLGRKTYELRRNDRDFNVGDRIVLVEVEARPDGSTLETGRELEARVISMLENPGGPLPPDSPPWLAGLASGWCVMGLALERAQEE